MVKLTKELKDELAAKVIKDLIMGMSVKQIITNYKEINYASQVSRLKKYALKNNIISIEQTNEDNVTMIIISPQRRHVRREKRLEDDLKRNFGLRNAIVVDFPYTGSLNAYDPQQDNELHKDLGRALAEHLVRVLRTGDHILVGGGRGTFFTAHALRRLEVPPTQKEIRVTAMCGNCSTTLWKGEDSDISPDFLFKKLDADDVTYEMATAFPNGRPIRLSLPAVLSSPSDLENILANGQGKPIAEKSWQNQKYMPTVALVGVGALAGGHKFFQYVDSELFDLEPIRDYLVPLRKISDSIYDVAGYYPVGDIAYYLFYINPPRKIKIPDEQESEIKNLIEKINERVVTVLPKQLNKIQNITVIAGGAVKWDALYTILSSEKLLRVDDFCTDKMTAECLLERNWGAKAII